jgi:hypothetical protein
MEQTPVAYYDEVICATEHGRSHEYERYIGKSQCSGEENKTPKACQYQRVSNRDLQKQGVHEDFYLPVNGK